MFFPCETITHLKRVLPNLKEYKTDLAFDLSMLFKDRAKRFKNKLSEDDDYLINRHIRELESFIIPPEIQNKVYIICGSEMILSIVLNISDSEINTIKCLLSDEEKFNIDYHYISTLYVIEKDTITLCTDIYPQQVFNLSQCFLSKNLLPRHSLKKEGRIHDDVFGFF